MSGINRDIFDVAFGNPVFEKEIIHAEELLVALIKEKKHNIQWYNLSLDLFPQIRETYFAEEIVDLELISPPYLTRERLECLRKEILDEVEQLVKLEGINSADLDNVLRKFLQDTGVRSRVKKFGDVGPQSLSDIWDMLFDLLSKYPDTVPKLGKLVGLRLESRKLRAFIWKLALKHSNKDIEAVRIRCEKACEKAGIQDSSMCTVAGLLERILLKALRNLEESYTKEEKDLALGLLNAYFVTTEIYSRKICLLGWTIAQTLVQDTSLFELLTMFNILLGDYLWPHSSIPEDVLQSVLPFLEWEMAESLQSLPSEQQVHLGTSLRSMMLNGFTDLYKDVRLFLWDQLFLTGWCQNTGLIACATLLVLIKQDCASNAKLEWDFFKRCRDPVKFQEVFCKILSRVPSSLPIV